MTPVLRLALPGDIGQRTGGYLYDRALVEGWRAAGRTVEVVGLPETFPNPSAEALDRTEALLSALPADEPVLVDGLAFGALPAGLLDRLDRRWVALVHHPLCLETGIAADDAERLRANERAALARARAVVVTSPATAATLTTEFGVPRERITVVLPGVEPPPRCDPRGVVPLLLSVGSAIPRKGYDLLLEALAQVGDLPWRCRIVGSLDRAPDGGAGLRDLLARHGLAGRVEFTGELDGDALARAYADASIYLHASRYEGFGMALAEALAAGLPAVASTGGAVADWLPEIAALRVPPGDVAALADATRRLIEDEALRVSLSDAAIAFAATLPRWPDTAARVAGLLDRVAAG